MTPPAAMAVDTVGLTPVTALSTEAGASGLATGWTVQHDPQTPGIQTLVVTEDETSVEIAGG